MTLAQDSINLVDRPLPPAGRQAGTEGGDAGWTFGLEPKIAPGLPSGEAAGLAGEVAEGVPQGAKAALEISDAHPPPARLFAACAASTGVVSQNAASAVRIQSGLRLSSRRPVSNASPSSFTRNSP